MSAQSEQDRLVNVVSDRYRRDGYDVQPGPGVDLPFDLGGYQPDLVARKDDQTLLIEIKMGNGNRSYERLRSVIEEVGRHKGWRFVLVTERDLLTDLPQEEKEFSWNEVDLRIKGAQRLVEQGEEEAGFLVLWITFERVLRFLARQASLAVDRPNARATMAQLYSLGELTMLQYDTAIALQKVRNRIVHGFPAEELDREVERLALLLREVAEQSTASFQMDA